MHRPVKIGLTNSTHNPNTTTPVAAGFHHPPTFRTPSSEDVIRQYLWVPSHTHQSWRSESLMCVLDHNGVFRILDVIDFLSLLFLTTFSICRQSRTMNSTSRSLIFRSILHDGLRLRRIIVALLATEPGSPTQVSFSREPQR